MAQENTPIASRKNRRQIKVSKQGMATVNLHQVALIESMRKIMAGQDQKQARMT
jgi:hypothetical protein